MLANTRSIFCLCAFDARVITCKCSWCSTLVGVLCHECVCVCWTARRRGKFLSATRHYANFAHIQFIKFDWLSINIIFCVYRIQNIYESVHTLHKNMSLNARLINGRTYFYLEFFFWFGFNFIQHQDFMQTPRCAQLNFAQPTNHSPN